MVDWYSKLYSLFRWEGCYSTLGHIRSGVRQGGDLSQALFNIYIRCVIDSLVKSALGCHVYDVYVGCLMYADDIVLLSASVVHFQSILDIGRKEGPNIDIIFNAKKSSLFTVGKSYNKNIDNIYLGADEVLWSPRLNYLRLTFKAGI